MKVNKSLEEVSDGKLYGLNDMVKADTRGCNGCSACCHGVGDTIVLNPFDMYEMVRATKMTYDQLIDHKIALHLEEKVLLPNLKMQGVEERCGFLNQQGWCDIHKHRPGICRLFPLGRYYEGNDFHYIFKEGECIMANVSKIKVKKWIGINDYQDNKSFVLAWHQFLKALKWRIKFVPDPKEQEAINDYVINHFYQVPWQDEDDFYRLMDQRLIEAKDYLGLL